MGVCGPSARHLRCTATKGIEGHLLGHRPVEQEAAGRPEQVLAVPVDEQRHRLVPGPGVVERRSGAHPTDVAGHLPPPTVGSLRPSEEPTTNTTKDDTRTPSAARAVRHGKRPVPPLRCRGRDG